MDRPKKRHTITVTFSRPLSEHAARRYLHDLRDVVDAFAVVSKAAWEKNQKPTMVGVNIKRIAP